MAVIKRTECRDCGISAGGVHLRECPRWTTDMRVVYERDTVEVEYVPAGQLAGAVSDHDALAKHLEYALDALEGRPWTGWNTDDARAILSRAGGQSDAR